MYFPGIGNSCLVSLQVVWKREAAVDLLLLLKAETSDQFCEGESEDSIQRPCRLSELQDFSKVLSATGDRPHMCLLESIR
jgi:hypothetical protein